MPQFDGQQTYGGPSGEGRQTLLHWATHVLEPAGYTPAAHHRLLIEELDAISRGENNRLIVLMPPGSAKSTYASVLFPAWWFTQHSKSAIIAASHTAGLAQYLSRRVRDLIQSEEQVLGYGLASRERSVTSWRTTTGGEYMAAGVRGSITGRRADLVIIDDPVKSRSEADSPNQREHLWNWFRADLITRLKPKARVVLVMTRWHETDLSGRLIEQDAPGWRIVRLPALAESDDPLGRDVDDPLWPAWETHEDLLSKRKLSGERTWSSLFQQTPRPPEGGIFKVPQIGMVDQTSTPRDARVIRAWDLAGTEATESNDPDWTVGMKVARDRSGHYTILDVTKLRGSSHQVQSRIIETARIDGESVWISLPQDPGQAGKFQVEYLTDQLAGHNVLSFPDTGSKLVRAFPVASQIEAGNITMLRADWNGHLIEELRDFPVGRKDDQVDALTRAFLTFPRLPQPTRSISLPLIGR